MDLLLLGVSFVISSFFVFGLTFLKEIIVSTNTFGNQCGILPHLRQVMLWQCDIQ